jgi:hypothetical protein
MDDNNFDDLLKDKLRNYEDPTFDPSALEGLRDRLSNFQPTRWYASNGLRIAFVSSLFLLTSINTYFFIYNSNPNGKNYTPLPENKRPYSKKIDSLKAVIEQLQWKLSGQNVPLSSPVSSTSPKFQLPLSTENKSNDISLFDPVYKIRLGSKENIPLTVYNELKNAGFLADEHGEVLLIVPKKTNTATLTNLQTSLTDLLVPTPQPGRLQLISTNTEITGAKKPMVSFIDGEPSLAAKNTLEKHYFNNLGVQLAPHVDLVKGIFSQGSGGITPRVGLTADWLFSPRFSMESGIDYSTTKNLLSQYEIPSYAQYNPQLGNCEAATLTNRLVSAPLGLKYRQWVSGRSQLILKGGYTPYWTLTKQSQYNYVHPGSYPSDADVTTTLYNQHSIKYFGSTISIASGFTIKRDKNKGTWEALLYYEHNLGEGFEQKSMQLIGLRTAYWFKVK